MALDWERKQLVVIAKGDLKSLYFTTTQNHSLWGLVLVKIPNATILRWRYQHVDIQKANIKLGGPNASQFNIGCIGSRGVGFCVVHVHFMLFVSISFVLGNQFPVEYGLNVDMYNDVTEMQNLNAIFHCNTKTTYVRALHWVRIPTRAISFADTIMLVSEKPCEPNATPKREPIMPNTSE